MDDAIINRVKTFVKEDYKKSAPETKEGLKGHFEIVEKYANKLCEKEKGSDKEIVKIAVWLHDIGTIKGDYKNHGISGAKIAGEFLRSLNYPKVKIEQVKHCIRVHRGSKSGKVETKEAQILIDADAITHFDEINLLVRMHGKKETLNKLERSYDKLSSNAKFLVKNKLEKARKDLS